MIDVIEIDAASYTGVDNIREIIDHARFTPTQGKYKVYIIDEVHMLSKGAFNALLKTLEEPPAHAIFLLATTEIHKIPDTILSRVIRFDLTKIGEADMRGLLQKICTQEGITYEEEALNMIIHRSRGSLRDSLTMLEKCIFEKSVQTINVEAALHLVNHAFLRKTFDAVRNGKSSEIQSIIEILESESADIRQFSAQMTEWIVENISEAFEQRSFPLYREIFDLFTSIFIQSKQVAVPMDILRMALYERIRDNIIPTKKTPTTGANQAESMEKISAEPEVKDPPLVNLEVVKSEPKPASSSEVESLSHNTLSEPAHELPAPTHELPPADSAEIEFSLEVFLKKIQELGVKTTLLPLLKTATISMENNAITIITTTFGKSRCEESNTYLILSQAATSFWAQTINIVTIGDTSPEEVQTDSLDLARAIFE